MTKLDTVWNWLRVHPCVFRRRDGIVNYRCHYPDRNSTESKVLCNPERCQPAKDLLFELERCDGS